MKSVLFCIGRMRFVLIDSTKAASIIFQKILNPILFILYFLS